MTTETLAPYLVQKFFGNDGTPLAYGILTTYSAGSTTPVATYIDSTGATPNTNPIILNARGECSLWLSANVGYKFALTDSSGNAISGYPVDNVINSFLLSLYGGVDTGSANAYVLNFTASFTSLADGIVLYWYPSHANTGASTINVNGLGVVPIINQNGTALTANEIINAQIVTIMYKGGNWILIQGAQQGIVSYGGIDTGTANAYVVTLTNQYFAYASGNVLFFIPNNTNTGASVLNVKGLGAVNIVNATGMTLTGGELTAGNLTQVVYLTGTFGTFFQIVSPAAWAGSFVSGGISGGTGGGTPTLFWNKVGNEITLQIPAISVTSTSNVFNILTIPANIQPISQAGVSQLVSAVDNTSTPVAAYFTVPIFNSGTSITITVNTITTFNFEIK